MWLYNSHCFQRQIRSDAVASSLQQERGTEEEEEEQPTESQPAGNERGNSYSTREGEKQRSE